jgi:hypothetical protein
MKRINKIPEIKWMNKIPSVNGYYWYKNTNPNFAEANRKRPVEVEDGDVWFIGCDGPIDEIGIYEFFSEEPIGG